MRIRFLLLLVSIVFSINTFAQKKSDMKYVTGSLGYYIHTIAEGETLSGLAMLYNVSVKNIKEVNPTISDIENIKYGQKIVVPNFDDYQNKYPFTHWEYALYKVQKGDKLKSIAKDLNSDVKDIKEINRNIDNKPHEGILIRVPVKRTRPLSPKNQEPNTAGTGNNPATDYNWGNKPKEEEPEPEKEGVDCKKYTYKKGTSFNILYSLPLDLYQSKKLNSGISFLEGALLAVDELKKQGISFTINVVEETEVLNESVMKNCDLIISLEPNADLIAFSEKNKIPLVASYMPKLGRKGRSNPYLFQIYPSDDAIYNKMVTEPYDPSGVVLLVRPLYTDSTMLSNYKNVLTKKYKTYKEYIHTVGQRANTEISSHLIKGGNNLIYVCSNDELFISDFLDRTLVHKSKGYPMKVYGRYQWRNFKRIEPSKYFDINLNVVLPFYVDYSDADVLTFVKEYRLTYNTDPIQFAFHGYDISKYFLSTLKDLGPKFNKCIESIGTKAFLQSKIRFEKHEDGAFINKEPLIIEYSSDIDIIKK